MGSHHSWVHIQALTLMCRVHEITNACEVFISAEHTVMADDVDYADNELSKKRQKDTGICHKDNGSSTHEVTMA